RELVDGDVHDETTVLLGERRHIGTAAGEPQPQWRAGTDDHAWFSFLRLFERASTSCAESAWRENSEAARPAPARERWRHSTSSVSRLEMASASSPASSVTEATESSPGSPCAPTVVVASGTPFCSASTTLPLTPAP